MAIGYGLGIGLQAKPKDYVEIIKSREQAVAKARAAKAAKDEATLNRISEKFTYKMGEGKVLPWQQSEKDNLIIEWEKIAQEETEKPDPDFNRLNRFTADAMSKMTEMRVQYDDAHKLFINPVKYGFTPEEAQIILSERDPQKVVDFANNKGVGITVVNNRFLPSQVDGFNENTINNQLYTWLNQAGDKMFDPNLVKETRTVLGTKFEYTGTAADAKASFMASQANNPYSIREFEMFVRNTTGKKADMNDPAIQSQFKAYVEKRYDDFVKPLRDERMGMAKTTYSRPAAPSTTSTSYQISVGTTNNIKMGASSFTTLADLGIKNIKASGVKMPTGTKNLDNGDIITSTSGDFSFSGISAVPVDGTGQLIEDNKIKQYPEKLSIGVFGNVVPNNTNIQVPMVNTMSAKSLINTTYVNMGSTDNKAGLEERVKELESAINWYNSLSADKKKAVWESRSTQSLVEAQKSGGETPTKKKASDAGKMKP